MKPGRRPLSGAIRRRKDCDCPIRTADSSPCWTAVVSTAVLRARTVVSTVLATLYSGVVPTTEYREQRCCFDTAAMIREQVLFRHLR